MNKDREIEQRDEKWFVFTEQKKALIRRLMLEFLMYDFRMNLFSLSNIHIVVHSHN